MKKRILTLLFSALSLTSLVACGGGCNHEYEFKVDDSNMKFKSGQVLNENADFTGLKAVKECKKCQKQETLNHTIEFTGAVTNDNKTAVVVVEDIRINYEFKVRNKVKVACVGDSLTYGHVWQNEAYPVYLQEYLGNKYNVGNFGENGDSVTGYGGDKNDPEKRYIKRNVYTQSVNFEPEVIAIMLGTNDGTDWEHAEPLFTQRYHELIDSYNTRFPNVQWVFMVAPPCESPNTYGISNDNIKNGVNPKQREIAEEYDMATIDLREEWEALEGGYQDMLRDKWNGQTDKVHFTQKASKYVAQRVVDTMDDFQY